MMIKITVVVPYCAKSMSIKKITNQNKVERLSNNKLLSTAVNYLD